MFSMCMWVVLAPALVVAAIWAIWAALKPVGGGNPAPSDRLGDPVEDEAETFFASEGLIFEDEQME